MNDYIVIYEDMAEEWRWSYRSGNHKKMGDSGEGYGDKSVMFHALERVCGGSITMLGDGLVLHRGAPTNVPNNPVPILLWNGRAEPNKKMVPAT